VATAAPIPSDDGGLGANSFLYLNRKVPKLTIEVDAVAGAAPSGATLDLVRRRLAGVADKPGGITILPTETIGGQADGVWSTDDLAKSRARNRDRRSTSDAMVMYLAFLDGRYEQDDAVGVAWSASTVAVFVEHIEEISTLLVGADAIEAAATVHEVGHLLSLVNLGYRSPRAREDPDHPKHSSNPDSVMYWAVDNVGVVTILGGKTEPPTDFDAADRADLAAVRDGDLG
jgi:hypothetical protein